MKILWSPAEYDRKNSNMYKFMDYINSWGVNINSYNDLYNYSVNNIENFWENILNFFDIKKYGSYDYILSDHKMPGNIWFKGLKLNYAENALNHDGMAIVHKTEVTEAKTMTYTELKNKTSKLYNFLKENNIKKGDVIASYMPNVPENVITFLASAALGSIFSSTAMDFGSKSVIERFNQLKPKVLVTSDGYSYNGKIYDKTNEIREIIDNINSIETVIIYHYINKDISINRKLFDFDYVYSNCTGNIEYERMDFNDPLWVLFSSGTTGKPKGIVHSHGGIILEHLKSLSLHINLKKNDRLFWYTSTGWMMWNFLIGSLLTGSTMVLYDGSPFYPDNNFLWDFLNKNNVKYFGTSAAYITHLRKINFMPGNTDNIRGIFYTGSPLDREGYEYIYKINKNFWFSGISGGTDICSAFFMPAPLLNVYDGEMQCIALGDRVRSYDENGTPVIGNIGELVVEEPMPSMPVYLWNDKNYGLYKDSYFNYYKNVWRHGDFIEITERNTAIIYGRSDATLNKNGIRIGTSDIYSIVENIPEVKESLIVGIETKNGYYMPLFVAKNNHIDDNILKAKIRSEMKKYLPRYLPDDIFFVNEIPKTLNSKKMEVPVKRILMGYDINKSINYGSVLNPGAIKYFIDLSKKLKL